MARAYRYISGDSHLEIDSKWYADRVPARYRERVPRLVRLPDGGDAWLVEGQPLREVATDLYAGKGRDVWQPFGQNYETTPGTGPAEQRLEEQDRDGIDAEIFFPGASAPRLWRSIKSDDAYRAVVRAYNDWMTEDYCSVDPARLIGLGFLPWTGVDDAIAEMERCAKLGFKGVNLGAFPSGKGYPTSDDDRFWAAALDINMPIAVHHEFDRSAGGPLLQFPGADTEVLERMPATRGFVDHVSRFGREGAVNAIQLALAGVFDRFPRLRIFFGETQIGWIPFFMEMAEVRFARHSGWAERLLDWKPMERRPSEYVREHCYWGFQHDRVGVELRDKIGVDRIIWATDFPHQDSEWPNSMGVVAWNFTDVPEDETFRMVAVNAIEFFHLDALPSAQEPAQPARGSTKVAAHS
ncbi:MAG: amidohydrolase family protein [Chloroflexi bacterium]|nr:amidohydrolase family protein [Chloroflexota bacterium]